MFIGNRNSWSYGVLACALTWLAPAPAVAQPRASDAPLITARYDPHLEFRTISTARFDIHFHQGEEQIAGRLLRIADQVAAEMQPILGTPRGRLHVILVDQHDEANGWATVLPYNTIEVSAASPRAHSLIGNSDDWLRLVFTHEYTHVLHLEKSGGWPARLRRVFGRLPLFYPNLALPQWQIEGIATFEESARTGRGRVPAGDFRMIVDRAAAAGRYAPLDRVNGGVITWPSGTGAYAYGAYFHQCLAARYGAETLVELAEETGSRLPYFGSRAFRAVYGKSLGELWEECETHITERAPKPAGTAARLTRHGFFVTAPAFSADGRLFYSASNPHGFPAVLEYRGERDRPRHVTSRVRGNRLAIGGGTVIFDQMEMVRNVGAQSDIFATGVDGRGTRRLTRHARAADPDVAADGTVVCVVQSAGGRRQLATFAMPRAGTVATPVVIAAEDHADFAWPRWSPDGRTIAAERQRLDGPSEIVLVDVASRAVRALVASAPARNVTPVWLPDGGSVLFAADRSGGPFALYVADAASGAVRAVAGGGDGAMSPAISPDGRRIVFVGYSADGYDLYSIPFDLAASKAEPGGDAPTPRAALHPAADTAAVRSQPYSPWPTLRPRFWLPVIEGGDDGVLIGAATAGYDALGRHGFGATGAWSFEHNSAEWQIDYAYARWRPALFASVSRDFDLVPGGDVRSLELNAGGWLPTQRMRWSMTSMAAFHASRDRIDCPACETPLSGTRSRRAIRGGWRFVNAKSFGYSISAEQGAFLSTAAEFTRKRLGADGDAGAVTADARGYLRAFPRHGVVAARVAGAAAWGDARMRRAFSAGGSGAHSGAFDVGAGAIGLLRGFEESDLIGDRAAVVNVDYRFPIAWVERGVGTLPLLLRSVHGAIFADAGHAWDDRFRAADVRRAFGAELSLDVVLGYAAPLTIAGGVAWRGGAPDRRGGALFVRIGRAF